jgi:cell division protein FtsI (penicillin-binding protein 3)
MDANGNALCGLELHYNNVLTGRNGEVSEELGRYGIPLPNGKRTVVPKIDGEDIIISIDIGLQEYVESELAYYAALGNTRKGSILVQDGTTGEIYAAASLPLYNRETVSAEEIADGAMTAESITRAFEPGSTMKAVAAVAALEAGVIGVSETFHVPSRMVVDEYIIKDWYDRNDEQMNLRQILANSSNIGMALVGNRLSNQQLFDYYYRAGFYQPTHVDYVGLNGQGEPLYLSDAMDSNTGQYLSIADKPYLWSNILAANLTFGQGLSVTALQMAAFYGALANDGVRAEPHFLLARPQSFEQPSYPSERIMSSQTAETMTDLLESVMTVGTGTPAAVTGYRIAGKTGTAEKSDSNGYYGSVIQSMIGYFIDSDCDLVVMTTMDDSGLVGGAVAAKPLFASTMEYVANRYWVKRNDDIGSGHR